MNIGKTLFAQLMDFLPWTLRDLTGMDVKLLRQIGQRHLALDSGQSHPRFEGRCVIPAGSSAVLRGE